MIDLVLLPGTLCDERLFERLALPADVRTSVVGLTGADSIEGMAADVLAAAPARFALGGLSLGGIVALEIMRRAPHRVERLALLDANHRDVTDVQRGRWQHFERMVAAGDFARITVEHLLPGLLHHQDPDDVALVLDMAAAVGPAAFLRQNTALQRRPELGSILPTIDVPTLIVGGVEDVVCPPDIQEEMAAHVADAKLELVADAGHLVTLEAPAAVSRLLERWLLRW